ncbi:MAG: phosphate ABC transporter substrate-binding protein [Anaerolineae bacterium]|jgi:phosphate transport system substrate-binding protein|nr:phosphate ABC transporter substrate-binding protein [Anaerolineae bacterium]
MHRRLTLLPGLLSLLVVLAACGEPVATSQPVLLEASGSASMAPLLAELAAAFEEQAPGVRVEVSGPGTAFGLQALEEGEIDVALVSWLPGGKPPRPRWRATAIARDGLAIVVHPDNPLEGVGLLQLQDLYSGRIYDWEALGLAPREVLPVSREEGSGARAAFEDLVMEDRQVTPRALLAPSPEAVRAAVAANPGAIGYLALGNVTPEVKVLKVEGELPSPQNAAQGTYALTRELWLVTTSPAPAAVDQLLAFILAPRGQEIVGRRYGRIR